MGCIGREDVRQAYTVIKTHIASDEVNSKLVSWVLEQRWILIVGLKGTCVLL